MSDKEQTFGEAKVLFICSYQILPPCSDLCEWAVEFKGAIMSHIYMSSPIEYL